MRVRVRVGEGKVRFMDQYPMLFTLPTPGKLRPLS